MSYEMIMMLYLNCIEKAKQSIEFTAEYYTHIKNAREYYDILKDMDKQVATWS